MLIKVNEMKGKKNAVVRVIKKEEDDYDIRISIKYLVYVILGSNSFYIRLEQQNWRGG